MLMPAGFYSRHECIEPQSGGLEPEARVNQSCEKEYRQQNSEYDQQFFLSVACGHFFAVGFGHGVV